MSRDPAAPLDDEPDDSAVPGSGAGRPEPRAQRLRRVGRWVLAGHSAPELLRLPPAQVNRMLTVLACASMLIGARDIWNRTIVNQQVHAFAVILYFGAILVIAVLALSVRTRRVMTLVDAFMLAVAALQCVNRFYVVTAAQPPAPGVASSHVYYGTDEGSLIHMAARTLLHHGRIYGTQWPQIFSMFHVGTTPLMNGGAATGLDYPPLGPIFTAVPMKLGLSHPPAGLAATAMLLLASVVMFLLLPVSWRPVAVIVCFGFGWLPNYAQMGYPGCMELPFLLVTVAYWHRTGRGGRLGLIGVTQAVCLGIAACLHQLTWFLTPFLLIGMFMIRRGEMPARDAARVVLRYAAITAGVFLAINLPFILQGAHAWLRGVLTPLTQQAIPAGQGLVGISSFFTSGSGDLHLYSVAGQLLCLAMMVLLVLFPRRLGPAVTVMPWLVFYLSTRSQQDYFDLTVPLWVMAAATVSAADFDRAWHPRTGWLGSRAVRAALVPVLLAPTVVTIAAAILTPPPLTMAVTAMNGSDGAGELALLDLLQRVQVTVTNTSDEAVTPHFATSTGATISDYWKVLSGPVTLPAHSTAVYRLKAPYSGVDTPGVKGRILLRAVTPQPMSISSQLIGVGPDPSTLSPKLKKILDSGLGLTRHSSDSVGSTDTTGGSPVEGINGR
ncbi:hypothetical protein [Streptacidiphilus fuscans]|uniref:Uncharacterized protein n=1 Tax=Streptacidiphilus fuscans TaxID=2789292 RepID=A0A931FF07_9ACTN|nr:hypothetical protein [Streptacidiphilus fuscans]MBF9071133.1 hypothetical protein [Streptacidiphilus fuscans]